MKALLSELAKRILSNKNAESELRDAVLNRQSHVKIDNKVYRIRHSKEREKEMKVCACDVDFDRCRCDDTIVPNPPKFLLECSTESLKEELKKREELAQAIESVKEPYRNTYGLWKVTTEGDEKGIHTRDLGVHKGHIDEIAKQLASSVFYSLTFTAVTAKQLSEEPPQQPPKTVGVDLNVASGVWGLKSEMQVHVMKEIFKDRPVDVDVEQGNSYAPFVLRFK